MAIGPVQLHRARLRAAGLPRRDHRGARALRESDTVRVIDALAVYKDAEGEIEVMHLSNLTEDEAIELGSKVGALIGLGIEGEEGMEAGAEAGAEAAADGIEVFSDEDAWDVMEEIPNDSAAALILIEHHWAVPLRDAIARAGGFRISDGFISPLDLVEIGLLSAEEAQELHAIETQPPNANGRVGATFRQEAETDVGITQGRAAHIPPRRTQALAADRPGWCAPPRGGARRSSHIRPQVDCLRLCRVVTERSRATAVVEAGAAERATHRHDAPSVRSVAARRCRATACARARRRRCRRSACRRRSPGVPRSASRSAYQDQPGIQVRRDLAGRRAPAEQIEERPLDLLEERSLLRVGPVRRGAATSTR